MDLYDLFTVIDQYDEQTFSVCLDRLYEKLGFVVIGKEEVRCVDLKEKLADFLSHNQTYHEAEKSLEKPLAAFIKKALAEHFVLTEERAKKYYAQAAGYIAAIDNDGAHLETVENLVLIYISFFSLYKKHVGDNKREPKLRVSDVKFYLDREADDVVNYIYDKVTICGRTTSNNKIAQVTNLLIEQLTKKQKDEPETFTETEKIFAYIVTTLFVCRILQYEGEI